MSEGNGHFLPMKGFVVTVNHFKQNKQGKKKTKKYLCLSKSFYYSYYPDWQNCTDLKLVKNLNYSIKEKCV